MTHGGSSMADGDVADRQLPRVNTVHPVAVMILAIVKMNVGIGERFVGDASRLNIENVSADVNPAVFAFERRATFLALSANEFDAIRVLIMDFAPLRNFEQLLRIKASFRF